MASERLMRWRKTLWVVLASLLVHVAVVALFLLPDAVKQPEPAKEDTVSVELVPPPEEPKPPEPEKKPEAEKPPEPPKPPEAEKLPEPEKPPEPPKADQPPAPPEPPPAPPPPPPPPPAEKPPEEKPTPSPPPPAKKQPEEKATPQPPPAEKQPEEKTPPPPPPPEEKPPEESPKSPPPEAEQSRIPALNSVFRYGDKDAGPIKSLQGNSADGDTKPDAADAATADAAAAPDAAPEVPPVDQAAAAKPPSDAPPPQTPPVDVPGGAGPLPPDINLPEADALESLAEKNGPPSNSPDSAKVELSPAPPSDLPKDKPAPPKPGAAPKQGTLTKAKTLFSRSETGSAEARSAMGNIPRDLRIANLCATELFEQLMHSPSVHRLEQVQPYSIKVGNVLDVKRSQFRASGQWYNLRFRCEVDTGATIVLSFSFDIGAPVPRSEWQSRGIPDN